MKILHIIKFIFSIWIMICFFMVNIAIAQVQLVPEEQVIFYTQEWDGERDQYGRPVVADDIIERLHYVPLEQAWQTIRGADYHNKFEGDWEIMHPDEIMIGRALTATFMPESPELQSRMHNIGREQGLGGGMNQYPIYMLEQGDVYVADGFAKIDGGTLIGDNLGTSIFTNSGNGPVFYGSARNLSGLRNIEGFNAWVKGWHPSFIQNMTLMSINGPTRIGQAIVLPGDVVMAHEIGVLFIPPHLAERVVISSEVTRLVDRFRQQRISEGVYELGDMYGTQWTDEMNNDFYKWLETDRSRLNEQYGVGFEAIDTMIETQSRNWREWIND